VLHADAKIHESRKASTFLREGGTIGQKNG
jgi:hypothetical protein